MDQFANTLKILGDPTRLRLLRLLLEAETELCVCELVDSLEESQYNVSKHVAALRSVGLVESRRDGRWVYYRASRGANLFHRHVLGAVSAIPPEHAARDRKELQKRLRLRKDGRCLKGIQKPHLVGAVGVS